MDIDPEYFDEDVFFDQEDEDAMGNEDQPEDNTLPPEYLLKESIAKHKQLAQILAVYFHAKHAEPMHDVFDHLKNTQFETEHIESVHFHLDNNK